MFVQLYSILHTFPVGKDTWLRRKQLHKAKEYGSAMAAVNLNY